MMAEMELHCDIQRESELHTNLSALEMAICERNRNLIEVLKIEVWTACSC